MIRQSEIVKGAVVAFARFTQAYPWMCTIAAVIYAASAVLSARYLPALEPYGPVAPYLASWAGSLPQTALLAPVWTALPRFVILDDDGRRYFTWDYRVRRTLFVTVLLSAVLMGGGLLFAASLEVLPQYRIHPLFAAGVVAGTLGPKLVSWWLVMRLAIAPALAAAAKRRHALDDAFELTRGWIGTIFLVKLVIYAPLVVLVGGERLMMHLHPGVFAILFVRPLSVAAVTCLTALAEVIDAAAMALMAVRIVQAPRHEHEEQEEEEEEEERL